MKKTLTTILLMLLIISTAACNNIDEAQQEPTQGAVAEPSATQAAEPTPSPMAIPTTAPTASPTPIPTTTPEPTPIYAFIGKVVCTADEFVNIRLEPSTDSEILGQLPAVEVADVIEYDGSWVHIKYGDTVGYVHSSYAYKSTSPSVPVPMGDWAKILVNPTNLLPEGFAVELVDFEGGQVDTHIFEIATAMFADAKQDGVEFLLVDAYRSYETQAEQYEAMVQRYINKGYSRANAEVKAATITARPNTSEHQTGLVLDVVTPSYQKRNSGFADTEAFKWLSANAHNYGFTMRYIKGKEDITKVIYESWHWRFVGVKAATDMKISGECYEEYLGILD